MSEDIKRAKRMARLDIARIKGERAKLMLEQLEDVFEKRRQAYYVELVSKSRQEGAVSAATVWKMVALDDLVGDLDRDAGAGRIAERKLSELKEQSDD